MAPPMLGPRPGLRMGSSKATLARFSQKHWDWPPPVPLPTVLSIASLPSRTPGSPWLCESPWIPVLSTCFVECPLCQGLSWAGVAVAPALKEVPPPTHSEQGMYIPKHWSCQQGEAGLQ